MLFSGKYRKNDITQLTRHFFAQPKSTLFWTIKSYQRGFSGRLIIRRSSEIRVVYESYNMMLLWCFQYVRLARGAREPRAAAFLELSLLARKPRSTNSARKCLFLQHEKWPFNKILCYSISSNSRQYWVTLLSEKVPGIWDILSKMIN